MLTALAGPLSNLVFALVLTIILKLLVMFGVFDVAAILATNAMNLQNILFTMLMTTISFNVVFAVFNMLPIPPFDGSKVLFYFVPYKYRFIEDFMYKYSFIIVLVLVVTSLGSILITPVTNLIWQGLSLILAL